MCVMVKWRTYFSGYLTADNLKKNYVGIYSVLVSWRLSRFRNRGHHFWSLKKKVVFVVTFSEYFAFYFVHVYCIYNYTCMYNKYYNCDIIFFTRKGIFVFENSIKKTVLINFEEYSLKNKFASFVHTYTSQFTPSPSTIILVFFVGRDWNGLKFFFRPDTCVRA